MNKQQKLTLLSLFTGIFLLIIYATAFGDKKPTTVYGNDTTQNKLIKKEIENILKENNYTRIPNKDFDELIENKISSKVDDKFHFWLVVVGTFLAAIGTISGYAFRKMIKQNISEELKNQSNKYIEEYKIYELDGRLKRITKDFKESLENKLNTEFNKLVSECEDLLKEIETLNLKELKIKKLLSITIDQLTYMYYISLVADLPKMEELIKGHESICDIPVTAYTNLAILYSELFALLGEESYKKHGIEYCEKASTKDPLYGESRGTQLRIYGIDYFNNKKGKAKEDAKNLLQKIIKVDSLAYYTVNRLNRDTARLKDQYIMNLEQDLPSEFGELYKKAADYAIKNNLPTL